MLDQSKADLEQTISQLQAKHDSVDDEGTILSIYVFYSVSQKSTPYWNQTFVANVHRYTFRTLL